MSPTTLLIWASASLIGFRLSVENSSTPLPEGRPAPGDVEGDGAHEDRDADESEEGRVRLVRDDADDGCEREHPDQVETKGAGAHQASSMAAACTESPTVNHRPPPDKSSSSGSPRS